ncbi:hypothetical protein CDL15_Pgr023348 [Punica granatum]|uniref:Uncharacterized protein n=1 Tax=Punica granatum TaxID=22663 RepID=A0A218Y127_PUNGR|nr:hypothetical protein CDL15_Pgr023348 [Punica granatum]
MASEIYREMPMLLHNKSAPFQELLMISEDEVETEMENSCGWVGNIMLEVELRKKILIFRDFIDLPPCDPSSPIHNLMMRTVEDLYKLYPSIKPQNLILEKTELSIHEGLINLYDALKSVEGSWAINNSWISNFDDSTEDSLENDSLDQLGGRVLTKLHHLIKLAREMFDVMDDEEEYEDRDTPTLLHLEFTEDPFFEPFLLPRRIQAVRQLKLLDSNMRSFSFNRLFHKQGHNLGKEINKEGGPKTDVQEVDEEPSVEKIHKDSADLDATIDNSNGMPRTRSLRDVKAPPLPPPTPNCSSPPHYQQPRSPHPPNPPPTPAFRGALKEVAPPPPPLPPGGMAKALRAKKANAKLKRSTQMGKLYQVLKGKLEGRNLRGNLSQRRKAQFGASSGQGMADAIAEMTKRSTYFHQIEEDVEKYSSSIEEVKTAITAFQTKDMAELVKFHQIQVLARFEDFPTKKLEALRMAAALYLRLEGIHTELQSWKVEPPLNRLLNKIESYFNKIKEEIDSLERSKDEEMKRLNSHNIHFDFGIVDRIKESMVDVSSGCMELALKEQREINAASDTEKGSKANIKAKASIKMLWRAFQLAFRVYNFAGGQDDRADQLSKELAQEIEADPQQE